LNDQTKEENWVELKEVLEACSECVNKNVCKQMKTHVKHCFAAKYRVRCPIEVLDERTEDETK
jgi:hypothetical protein